MNANRTWTRTANSGTLRICNLFVEIRLASGGGTITSANVTLEADNT